MLDAEKILGMIVGMLGSRLLKSGASCGRMAITCRLQELCKKATLYIAGLHRALQPVLLEL